MPSVLRKNSLSLGPYKRVQQEQIKISAVYPYDFNWIKVGRFKVKNIQLISKNLKMMEAIYIINDALRSFNFSI